MPRNSLLIANVDHAVRLRQDPLFARLPNAEISRLLARLQAVEFAAGASLYVRDARAEFLYLIEEGSVQITTPGGRVVALSGLRCGEEAASDMSIYLCSATAITSVKALRIPRAVLTELAVTAPSLGMQALLGLSEELSGEKLQGPVTVEQPADKPLHPRELAGWFSVIAAPPAIYFLADSAGLIVEASLFLAILSATVLMWLFSLTDEFIPPLLAIAAVVIVGLVPAQIALAGFASPTMLLIAGAVPGLVLAGRGGSRSSHAQRDAFSVDQDLLRTYPENSAPKVVSAPATRAAGPASTIRKCGHRRISIFSDRRRHLGLAPDCASLDRCISAGYLRLLPVASAFVSVGFYLDNCIFMFRRSNACADLAPFQSPNLKE